MTFLELQKMPSGGVLKKRCSENMQQIYRRTPLLKCDVMVINIQHSFIKIHSTKLELRFSAGSNSAREVSEIWDDGDLWQWSRLETRLNAFRRSTIPQKQFNSIHYSSIKLRSNFIETTLQNGCSSVKMLYIFRTDCLKNTSGRLLLELKQLMLCCWATYKFKVLYTTQHPTLKSDLEIMSGTFHSQYSAHMTVFRLAQTRVIKIPKQVTWIACMRYFSRKRSIGYVPQERFTSFLAVLSLSFEVTLHTSVLF